MEKKSIDINQLNIYFTEVRSQIESIGIPISKRIEGPVINNRATARFGCCKTQHDNLGRPVYIIEVSQLTLAADEKNIKEVIAHELLHTCKGCLNHGNKWKTYGALVEKELGYNIKRTTTYQAIGLYDSRKLKSRAPKYILICQQCGIKISRTRRCKVTENPQKYRCGKCGGALKLFEKPLHLVDEK
ncbi:MAG: sprT domain-containing protein [Firmicutes bacterium]|nr:sprT domain-containing protein [Bacillota bacterium]